MPLHPNQVIVLAENYDGASVPIGIFPKDEWITAAAAHFHNPNRLFLPDFYTAYQQDHMGDWTPFPGGSCKWEELPGLNPMASAS